MLPYRLRNEMKLFWLGILSQFTEPILEHNWVIMMFWPTQIFGNLFELTLDYHHCN